jgi:hypothetical protein
MSHEPQKAPSINWDHSQHSDFQLKMEELAATLSRWNARGNGAPRPVDSIPLMLAAMDAIDKHMTVLKKLRHD